MEKKVQLVSVTVELKDETEKILLRDSSTFSKEELTGMEETFGKEWLTTHPIYFDVSEHKLNLSKYDISADELPCFAHIYNTPLNLKAEITKEIVSVQKLCKYQKVAASLQLKSLEPILSDIRDFLFTAKKILILIDLSGTLVCKSEKPLSGPRAYDLKLKRNVFYLRPGYKILLKKLLEHPRCLLAIYSSMVMPNIVPIKALLFREHDLKKLEGKCFKKIYDRHYNIKDPLAKDEHSTIRDLNKIWTDPDLKGKFGPDNTLLLDSDAQKARNFQANLFAIFPYVDDFVMNNIQNNSYYMNAVGDYLTKMLDRADGVPEYLLKTPFELNEELFKQEDPEFERMIEERKLKLIKAEQKKTMPEKKEEKKSEEASIPIDIEDTSEENLLFAKMRETSI